MSWKEKARETETWGVAEAKDQGREGDHGAAKARDPAPDKAEMPAPGILGRARAA